MQQTICCWITDRILCSRCRLWARQTKQSPCCTVRQRRVLRNHMLLHPTSHPTSDQRWDRRSQYCIYYIKSILHEALTSKAPQPRLLTPPFNASTRFNPSHSPQYKYVLVSTAQLSTTVPALKDKIRTQIHSPTVLRS